jgi:hypothetical protein
MQTPSTIRRRWRSWIRQIDCQIFEQAYRDKELFERYVEIVESNPAVQSPGNFHHWIFRSYAQSLLLQIRKISDSNKNSVNLRRLIGQVAEDSSMVTKRSYIQCYPRNLRDLADCNWRRHCGAADPQSLPRRIPLQDLDPRRR